MAAEPDQLDVITIGRASVDLYGQQIGGRLEDMASFAKSVGGCPSNIAIGCARLGLRAGVITRVGDEAMGRFIREQMAREGVDTRGIVTDAERLTALVVLGVRDGSTFPLIFFRENCADMALTEADIDPGFIASARAVVVTGTHFSTPAVAAASRKAMDLARGAGAKVVLDIDYRPNLWGLAGHGAGEARFIASAEVSAHLQGILPACHLIVGTEEELHIAGGVADTREALARVRGLSDAVIVCKRGPMGCVVFDGPIPSELEDGIVGAGFPVEVYNVLGAGDAFMAGFLRGWLTGEDHAISATWANACGAFAVSRLLCSPEIPTWPELEHFLKKGSAHRALRHDPDLNHIHHATTRRRTHPEVMAFAFDHRAQFEELADRHGAPSERIGAFKALALDAALEVQGGEEGFGILCDSRHGKEALFRAEGRGLWIGRPVEVPGSRPLRFEAGLDLGADLAQWPVTHVAKCLCLYHLDDAPDLRAAQEERLLQLHQACRGASREYMVEIVAGGHGAPGGHTVAGVLDRLYGLGVKPDWWKLEPQADATAWRRIDEVIARHDPYCRGVLLLGMDQPVPVLERAFGVARESRWVRGFAVGRTVFTEAAEAWFGGQISDRAAVEIMARGFAALVGAWRDIAAPEHPVA